MMRILSFRSVYDTTSMGKQQIELGEAFAERRERVRLSDDLALVQRGGEHLRLQIGQGAAFGGLMVRGARELIELEGLPVIAPDFRDFQRSINVEFGKRVLRNIDRNGDVWRE